MRQFLSLMFLSGVCFAQWVMFADSKDTYLYNTQTGEVYIRYKKKGKNYEDVFVKMPRGMSQQEIESPKHSKQEQKDSLMDSKMQSLKKSQEMINEALKGSF